MNIVDATRDYERWLRTQLSLVLEDDLALKHKRMAAGLFDFLRATYYHWLQRIERHAPSALRSAPALAAIGDLHVENFGCWRDAAGRLAWGANDFDEPATLPYTFDLLRLAASAVVAIRTERLPLHEHEACTAILEGYRESLAHGGRPFVVGQHQWLETTADKKVAGASSFWQKLANLPPAELPDDALALLAAAAPEGGWAPTLHRRTAGLGSLGHRRVVAVGTAGAAREAREVKELAPPATVWIGTVKSNGAELASSSSVAPSLAAPSDPSVRIAGAWRCRRFAPDTVRLELSDYARGGERRLLHAMGYETANVHLRAQSDAVTRACDHAARLTANELHEGAEALADDVAHNWHDWRHQSSSSGTSP